MFKEDWDSYLFGVFGFKEQRIVSKGLRHFKNK